MAALAWSESPTWYSITKKQITNISTWALWLTSLDNGHWWIALCHGACSQACCFACFVCFGTGCTPWELSNKHGAVLFRARQTLDEEWSWSHTHQQQPPQGLAWSSPLNPISQSKHSFREEPNALLNTTQHLHGMAMSGTGASELHGLSVTDGHRAWVTAGKDSENKERSRRGKTTKLNDHHVLQTSMECRHFLCIWISDTFCHQFKESVLPCKRFLFACLFYFYIWESIYRCCLGFKLPAEALPNRSLKIQNFLCENVHHICLCSEDLDLICSMRDPWRQIHHLPTTASRGILASMELWEHTRTAGCPTAWAGKRLRQPGNNKAAGGSLWAGEQRKLWLELE